MANIILTAIITFVISGIGGLMLERWLSKAKPLIMINNINFDHYRYQVINIGEDSAEIAQSIPWDTGLQNHLLFYAYEINESIRNLKNLVKELEPAVKECEQWMETHHHEPKKRKGTPELYINDVKSHPIFRHPIISHSLVGDLQRIGEIAYPPVSLENIRSSENVKSSSMFDLYQVELVDLWKKEKDDKHNSLVVDSGMKNYITAIDDDSISDLLLLGGPSFHHIFKRSQIKIEDQRRKCTTLAESFSRCIDNNIFYYTTEFINHSFTEISHLKQLISNLEYLMENKLTIFIELSVYNFGQTAIAIDSSMGLKIFNRIKGDHTLIFKASTISSGDFLSSLESGNQREIQNKYINLNPISSYTINLKLVEYSITIDDIKELKSTYNTGVLTCILLAKTNAKKKILTEIVDFGIKGNSKTYDEIRQDLLHLRC